MQQATCRLLRSQPDPRRAAAWPAALTAVLRASYSAEGASQATEPQPVSRPAQAESLLQTTHACASVPSVFSDSEDMWALREHSVLLGKSRAHLSPKETSGKGWCQPRDLDFYPLRVIGHMAVQWLLKACSNGSFYEISHGGMKK